MLKLVVLEDEVPVFLSLVAVHVAEGGGEEMVFVGEVFVIERRAGGIAGEEDQSTAAAEVVGEVFQRALREVGDVGDDHGVVAIELGGVEIGGNNRLHLHKIVVVL